MNEAQGQVEQAVEETTNVMTQLFEFCKLHLPTLLFAIALSCAGLLLTKAILRVLDRCLKRSNVDDAAAGFLHSLLHILLATLVIVIALSVLGVPMTSIITVIGAAGLAIGLALQDSLSNLAGGFIILFSRPFKAGDYIQTASAEGTVESVSILYTKITTVDNRTVYIPNGTVSGNQIVNYSEKAIRMLQVEFPIAYQSDHKQAMELLETLAGEHPLVLQDRPIRTYIGRYEDSSVVLFLRVWTLNSNYFQLQCDLLELAKVAFDQNGVEIPFPQLDVRMK